MIDDFIKQFILGPLGNNTYLLLDHKAKNSIVIDPAIGSSEVLHFLETRNYSINQIWITHAHFDHFAGLPELVSKTRFNIPVYLHTLEIDIFHSGGGIKEYLGKEFILPHEISIFPESKTLFFSDCVWNILHTPGHRPGHVVFHSRAHAVAFCGDLIFKRSIGRTDLSDGNYKQIIASIKKEIFTLPDETILLPGHGPSTTVCDEKQSNPFLR